MEFEYINNKGNGKELFLIGSVEEGLEGEFIESN